MAVAYYYDHMTKPKQAAYRSMLAGSQSFQTVFSFLIFRCKGAFGSISAAAAGSPGIVLGIGISFPSLSGFAEPDHEAGVFV